MTWETALNDYTNYLRLERGLSDNSIQSYRSDLRKLEVFLSESKSNETPLKIKPETIQEYLYREAKELKPRSQARLVSSLKGFFAYLQFENYRDDNPTSLLESPRLGRKLPDTLSLEEIIKMIDFIKQKRQDLEVSGRSHHPNHALLIRNEAILETLYSCGLRVSELTHLKLSDLFFEEGFIRVHGKGNKQRFVPITEVAVHCIELYMTSSRSLLDIASGHEDILFLNRRGKQLTRAMIFTLIRQAASLASVKKKISPHTFRHSFATHLLQGGADLRAIQQMLGHESITTTEVYVHLDRSDLKKSILKHHPRN
ncbi:tyrosine recombinase XerD [Robertkochia marina]|uniref:Tyrosine recombinase XerC n=1 Tax=Robertkochia marina TaxID=1227945 RepID=A0A4S3M0Q6_9FLAO|nr:site-specific tyrosine recombinase [Robertkochia marina]THD68012.1 tyrosine recombinase XerD [Robertkochia marina]TRZ42702.1 tyrosine recombinase XerD [Robertkochia marina]